MRVRRTANQPSAAGTNAVRAGSRRIFIMGNPEKPEVVQAFADLQAFAQKHCHLVGAELTLDGQVALQAGAGRIIVLGGDGTLLGVCRSLGKQQVPLIGVNLGKLGFLSEFTVDELQSQFDRIVTDDTLISPRMILKVVVHRLGTACFESLCVNDCVIQAGPPFRMVTLNVSIDGTPLTTVSGDGLMVCTPSGSTGHNLSAGGPIVQAGVKAIVITPIAPHSLTHRPLVVERQCEVEITPAKINPGTTVIIDGQVLHPLTAQDRIVVKRYDVNFQIVRNPQHPRWHSLTNKLRWGQPPEA